MILSFLTLCDFTPALIISIVSFALQGIGSALNVISSYAIITTEYPEEVSKNVAYLEIAFGLGFALGPSIGSIIYSLVSFSVTCWILSSSLLLYLPALYCLVGVVKPHEVINIEFSIYEVISKPVKYI